MLRIVHIWLLRACAQGHDVDRLWTNIVRVIVKSIIGVQPLMVREPPRLWHTHPLL